MKLSVLDQSPIRSGGTAADALRETIELAQITERLGYHRYWVAEHHGSASFAGSSPEVLISTIAAHTSRIRVGSGGVMLMHYSPLKVAENFRLLETLYPGRIDLGVGRAPGKRRHHRGCARVRIEDRHRVFPGQTRGSTRIRQRRAAVHRGAQSGARDARARDDTGNLDAGVERRRRAARRAFRIADVVCAFHQPTCGTVVLSDLSRHVQAQRHVPGASGESRRVRDLRRQRRRGADARAMSGSLADSGRTR